MVTDKTLYVENPTLFNNMLFISRRLRPERVEDEKMLVAKAVSVLESLKRKGGKARIAQLIENHDDFAFAEETFTTVCYLLMNGIIEADLGHKELSYESEVWVNA